jgi:hypothetical protein
VTFLTDVDQLFALPLEEFTAARNALAKELTQAGDRDGAATVKAMRKPSVTAWALNQVSRARSADIDRLLATGEQLRRAQHEALEGDPSQLRDARRTFQDEVDRVVRAAGEVLVGAGNAAGPPQLDRLSSTLRATATDDEARGLVRTGRLDRDFEASGFGIDEGAGALLAPKRLPAPARAEARPAEVRAATTPAPTPPPAQATTAREVRRLATLAQRAEAKAQRLLRDAEEAERNAIELRRLADEAVEAAASAKRTADDAGHRTAAPGSVP